MWRFSLKDYIRKQSKFSAGNVFSIPVGSALLVFFTSYLHIWYLYSSWLAFVFTTVMNFWVQVALKNIRLDDESLKTRKGATSEPGA